MVTAIESQALAQGRPERGEGGKSIGTGSRHLQLAHSPALACVCLIVVPEPLPHCGERQEPLRCLADPARFGTPQFCPVAPTRANL